MASLQYILHNKIVEPDNPCQSTSGNKTDIELLLLVHSSLDHIYHRNLIRKTVPTNFKPVFVLGRDQNLTISSKVRKEQSKYRDLLIGNFIDSYKNLSVKHLLGVSFAIKNCQSVDFVAKMDDDVFVNFDGVTAWTSMQYPKHDNYYYTRLGSKLFACFLQSSMKVIRDPKNKWFVPKDELTSSVYLDFCSGWFYLTSIESLESIMLSMNEPLAKNPFWVDDVWVTGMLRSLSGDVFIESINDRFIIDPHPLKEWSTSHDMCTTPYLVSDCNGDLHVLKNSYKKLREMRRECGRKCLPCGYHFNQQESLFLTGRSIIHPYKLIRSKR